MSEIRIRQNIPDAWAEHACCPLCGAAKMRVQHAAAGVDQLRCLACGLAFELEMDGARLHVSRWPDSLPFLHIMVSDDWRSATELRSLVKQMASGSDTPVPPPPVVSSQPPPVTPAKAEPAPEKTGPAAPTVLPPASLPKPALDAAAIGIRIKQLRALGNSPQEIRATLTKAEKDPERRRAILGIITQMEQQEQARQNNKLVWSLGILMVIVILLVGAGIIFKDRFVSQNQPVATSVAGAAPVVNATPPPALMPNQAVKALNLNTPVVKYGAIPTGASSASAKACPRSAQDAANLFGGKPADWYYPPSSNGWVMAHAGGSSADIFVPKGMKAAYLQLSDRLNLIEVIGPATMTNAYYVAISCP